MKRTGEETRARGARSQWLGVWAICCCFWLIGCGEDGTGGVSDTASTSGTSGTSGATGEDTSGTSGSTSGNTSGTSDIAEDGGTSGSTSGTTDDTGQTSGTDDTSGATAQDTSSDGDDGQVLPEGVTYHNNIRALMETRCVGCHVEGGVGPFKLNYDPTEWETGRPSWATVASVVVKTKQMPPWMPEDGCRDIHGSRNLTPDELLAFEAWSQAGFPEGDPSTYVPPTPAGNNLGAPDIQTDSGVSYQPNRTRPDDYHCFPLDQTFDVDTYVRAYDVIPDAREIVHHVILYLVEPGDVQGMINLDNQEAGPGYTCFGGPRAGNGQTLAGWVPGQQPFILPEGAASIIPAGSRIVMQIHYNTLGFGPNDPTPTDQTQAALWLTPNNAAPAMRVDTVPFPNLGIRIQPDDPASTHDQDVTLPAGGTIIGALPHMHTLGTQIRVDLVKDGTPECVVNIPSWDFNWQQTYMFEQSAWLSMSVGDVHRMRCVYDNTQSNQPVVNGQQLEPRLVTWGEGTTDEMCLNYLVVMRPYGGSGLCGGFEECVNFCADGDEGCFLSCAVGTDGSCIQCLNQPLVECATEHCPSEGFSLIGCLNNCSGDTFDCLLGQCGTQYDQFHSCMEPHIKGGDCNTQFQACGVSF
jgi:hypothetical protein